MSKPILCRIDPEDLWISLDDLVITKDNTTSYLKAHAVPEESAPVIFAGVEEVWKWADKQRWFFKKDDIKQLLDRFGIQWEPGSTHALLTQYKTEEPHNAPMSCNRIDRPVLSLEDRREKARKLLETADDEMLKKLGV